MLNKLIVALSPCSCGTGGARRGRKTTAPASRVSEEEHTWVEYTPSKELYDAWEKLPLIILAGLR